MNNTLDLTACDKEKIHQITSVQGHGAFVAVSPLDMKIHNASDNICEFFGIGSSNVQVIIGKKLNELISHELSQSIQEKLRSGSITATRQGRLSHKGEATLDIFMYQLNENLFGIEFDRLDDMPENLVPIEEMLNDFVQKMHGSQSLKSLATEACRAVRLLTGMDRVMIYKFFPPSMYGEVIAEDKIATAHTFLNHRFPATDIPKPARDLYMRNHVRFIYDSHEETADIYPKYDSSKQTLDMSDSRLRGVSLIHIEYLKNMNVRGSLSLAIIIDNKLWGIISCHSMEPVIVSHAKRAMCETIANTLALGASLHENMENQTSELKFFNKFHALFDKLKTSHNPLDQLFREGNQVLELFNCNGMVLVSNNKTDLFGVTPLPKDIQVLWAWLLAKMTDEGKTIFATSSLVEERKDFINMKDQVSGLLAIRLSEVSDTILILMRSEYVETIYWGGDPRKNIDARNYGGVINPRVSFDTWTEVLKNSSLPWQKHEMTGVEFFKNMIFDALVAKEAILNELIKSRSE